MSHFIRQSFDTPKLTETTLETVFFKNRASKNNSLISESVTSGMESLTQRIIAEGIDSLGSVHSNASIIHYKFIAISTKENSVVGLLLHPELFPIIARMFYRM